LHYIDDYDFCVLVVFLYIGGCQRQRYYYHTLFQSLCGPRPHPALADLEELPDSGYLELPDAYPQPT